MPRIRTVKPDFFSHELLNELECSHPDLHPMLVYEGLWTLCDNRGVFQMRPRKIHLVILPFCMFDMEASIKLLEKNKQLILYQVEGDDYGYIPTFLEHQRITGKEKEDGQKYPLPEQVKNQKKTPGKQPGNTGETSGNLPLFPEETPEKHPDAQEKERERIIGKEGSLSQILENPNLSPSEKLFHLKELKQLDTTTAELYNQIIDAELTIKVNLPEEKKPKEKTSAEKEKQNEHSLCHEHFMTYYLQNKGIKYAWRAQDSGVLAKLITQLKDQMRSSNGTGITPQRILSAFSDLLERIKQHKDPWFYNHLTITTLYSKFNEIMSPTASKSTVTTHRNGTDYKGSDFD